MTKEEREDYLKYIENYTLNDLADEFNTQNFVIQDKDKFNEILLYYHFKEVDEIDQLQQENKKLKEHIEKYEHYCKTTGIEELMKENKKYKEVIDKAIEYIKYCQTSDDDIFPVIEAEKMIEILKGVE